MPYNVQLPDGRIVEGIPDDVSQLDAKKRILEAFPDLAATQKRGFGEAITDVGASLVSGVGQLAQIPGQISQLAGITKAEDSDTGLQGIGKQIEQFGQESKSPILRGKETVRAQKIEKADGILAEFGTAIKETVKDPALLTSFFAEQVPNLLGSWGGGLIARGTTKALMVGATEEALGKAGVRGAISTGAAMQGADVGSDTYVAAFKELKKQNPDMPDEEATGIALAKGRVAAIEASFLSLGAARLPGGATIERALAGKGMPGVGGFTRGFVGEAASEGLEEGGGKFISNVGLQEINPELSLTKGVGAAAGMGALGGGLFGGISGAVTGSREDQRLQAIADIEQFKQDTIKAQEDAVAAIDQARRDAYETEQKDTEMRIMRERLGDRFTQSDAYNELLTDVEALKAKAEQSAQAAVSKQEAAIARQDELKARESAFSYVEPNAEGIIEPSRPITETDFKAMNIGATNKKLRDQLLGKDLSNPKVAKEVKTILEDYAGGDRGVKIIEGVTSFLERPEFSIPEPKKRERKPKAVVEQQLAPEAVTQEVVAPAPKRRMKPLKPTAKEVLSQEEQDLIQQELQDEQTALEQQSAGETPTAISGPSEPSVRVPSDGLGTTRGIEQPERRGMVPVGNDVGQLIGREAPVQRTLKASGNLNKRQIKEFDEARDKYFTGAVDERTAKLDEKRGKPKGDPQEIALQMLAADLSSGENLKEAKRFHRGLPEAAKAYVADEISRLESVENKTNAEIDRLDAIRETQQQTAEAQGLGNIREKLTELGLDRLDIRDAIDTAKDEGNEKEASRLLKKLNTLDDRIKALEEQLPKVRREFKGQTTEALLAAVQRGDIAGALNAIAKDTSNTFNILEKLISNRLLANKGTLPKVEIVPAGTIKDGAAQYNAFTDTVQINEGEVDSHTVLHETVHGFLHSLIQKFEGGISNKGIADLKRLYDFIQENHPELSSRYGMENLTEFASELMSNREFQEELKNIPYRAENQSLFTAFIRAVLNALGLSPTQKLSALASGLMAAEQSLATGRKIQEDTVTGKETMPIAKVAREADLDALYETTGANRRAKPTEETGAFQTIKDSTKSTQAAKSAVNKFLNTAETMLFSADAALNNAIRKELESNKTDWETVKQMMFEVSTSQATHADAVAMQFLQHGSLKYDPKAYKWRAEKGDDSWSGIVSKLADVAKKNGLSTEKVTNYAQQAFVAERLKGLSKADKDIYSHMTPEQIEAGLKFFEMLPELRDVQKSWNAVRKNTMDIAVQSGLYSKDQAKELLDIMDYVPFYRVEQLAQRAGPKEYGRGLIDFAKGFKIKGSEQEVANIFDNMERWTSYTVARAVKNRSALNLYDTAKKLFPDEVKDLRQDETVHREQNTIDLWVDGQRQKVEFKDPLFVYAFTGIESAAIPHFGFGSAAANILRKNIVLMPLFSISQLSQDSFGAMLTSGLKHPWLLPLEVAKEFTKTLRGRSAAAIELTKYGAVGVRDYSATFIRENAEIMAGLKKDTKSGAFMRALENFAMASDNAVRQAVYNMTMKETGDKALAVERAFEIINFKRSGASGNIQMLRQVIPFFGAYLQAQNVIYKTLSGKGIAPQQKKEARRILASNALKIGALAFMYAALSADDEDYQKMDPSIRDRHLLIPGTAFMLPLRSDLTLMPKLIAEYTYLGMTDNAFTDGKKIRRAMSSALAEAVLSPTVVPQVFKPFLEVGTNYNFFTGRSIIGQHLAGLETEKQYTTSTSELGKFIGSSGLIAPVNVDHIIKGVTGTTGGLILQFTNGLVNGVSDQPRPEKSWQDAIATTPGLSAFVAREYGNADKNDYYELRDEVSKAVNTLNDIEKHGTIEEYREFEGKRVDLLKVKDQVNNINRQLSELRAYERDVIEAPESRMDAEKKGQEIERIRQMEKKMLGNVNQLRRMAGY
jgi:hypothetical protein